MKKLAFRLAAVAVLVAGLALIPMTPDTAEAAAFQGLCDYYSDAPMTNLVGQHGYDCCGDRVDWGPYTEYKQCYVINCVWCPDES